MARNNRDVVVSEVGTLWSPLVLALLVCAWLLAELLIHLLTKMAEDSVTSWNVLVLMSNW